MKLSRLVIFLFLGLLVPAVSFAQTRYVKSHGAIIRGNTTQPRLSLIFSGHIFNDGTVYVLKVLNQHHIKGSFFFTGDFYRNPENRVFIQNLKKGGHYLGAHSNKHLLYCSWEKRDSLLVTEQQFKSDLRANYAVMDSLFGIKKSEAQFFMPPYEWYNKTIAKWTGELGLTLINRTPGILTPADYTTPAMSNYRTSQEIWQSVIEYEQKSNFNGFMMLIHPGTDVKRKDKFYYRLDELIRYLKSKGYQFVTVNELL